MSTAWQTLSFQSHKWTSNPVTKTQRVYWVHYGPLVVTVVTAILPCVHRQGKVIKKIFLIHLRWWGWPHSFEDMLCNDHTSCRERAAVHWTLFHSCCHVNIVCGIIPPNWYDLEKIMGSPSLPRTSTDPFRVNFVWSILKSLPLYFKRL